MDVNKLLHDMWADIERASRERIVDEAKRDPEKHALTRVMAKGAHTGFTFWPGAKRRPAKRREERTRFCVSTHRNAAGFFLLWREVERYRLKRGHWSWYETERFDWKADKSKKELWRIAKVKAERDKAEHQAKMVARLPDAPAEVRMTVDQAIRSMATE